MKLQSGVHWLEQGGGRRVLGWGVLVLALAGLSAGIAFKQFRGPMDELTMRQAEIGRALAVGEGFSTGVNYPQVQAWRAARGQRFEAMERFAELELAPLYPAVIGAVLVVVPERIRAGWWAPPQVEGAGYGGDYFLLGLNVGLFWVAWAQAGWLAWRWFGGHAVVVAVGAMVLSWPLWQAVLAVNGTALAMVVGLGIFQALTWAERGREQGGGAWWAWAMAGAMAGAAMLVDYVAVGWIGVVVGYAGWRGGRSAAVVATVAALGVIGPWLGRNVVESGRLFGSAGAGWALREGDGTAEPAGWRATLTAEAPELSLAKLSNKGLTALEEAVTHEWWGGGALLLAGFGVVGALYAFGRDDVRALRWGAAVGVGLAVVLAGLWGTGEAGRAPLTSYAPLIILFGAGFWQVLVQGNPRLAMRAGWVAAGVLIGQATPLAQNFLEPRRLPYTYPPYSPLVLHALGQEVTRRSMDGPAWMTDGPAGAAWYSGRRVWGRPGALREFYAIHAEQPIVALVLTPATLDRPFFSGLNVPEAGAADTRFGGWDRVHAGLVSEPMPAGFPLQNVQRLAGNFVVLVDERRAPWR